MRYPRAQPPRLARKTTPSGGSAIPGLQTVERPQQLGAHGGDRQSTDLRERRLSGRVPRRGVRTRPPDPFGRSAAERLAGFSRGTASAVSGDEGRAGEGVEAEVAAGFGPCVVLFGQDRADAADDDDGVGVGKIPTMSVCRLDLTVELFLWLFDRSGARGRAGTR